MNKLIVLDSNALLHRAFHALPPLTNKFGQETGAVYGYLLTMFKAVKDVGADYVVATFDTKAKTFRHEKFEAYKGTRAVTPGGIISQIPIMKEVLTAFEIPIFAVEGMEADDLIATICTMAPQQEKDLETYIVSGDLDSLQLVNEHTKVYTLGKGIKDTIIYDTDKVVERFGVNPDQMTDYKALTGDASDNIPGVPGIGKTTATDLIQRFGSIENLYQELATDTAVLKPRVKETLKKNKDIAFLSKDLSVTKRDVPIDFKIRDCKFDSFDEKKVEEVFKNLEFNTLINRIASLKEK